MRAANIHLALLSGLLSLSMAQHFQVLRETKVVLRPYLFQYGLTPSEAQMAMGELNTPIWDFGAVLAQYPKLPNSVSN